MRMLAPVCFCTALLLLGLPAGAAALGDGLSRTPPMGWSTWNRFHCDIDENLVRQSADAMAANGMRDAGYRYVNVDDCWAAPERDAAGRVQADTARFPSGIAALADYVHARGLRLGLYTSLGSRTCKGRPGLAGHVRDDLTTMAGWGIDYLKVDFCNVAARVRRNPAPYYARVRDAIRATRRRVVLGICDWGIRGPWNWGAVTGHLWRISGDLADAWPSVIRIAERDSRLASHAGPGGWNDPDMLQVGNGGMTATEDRAHFSLWAILAAPLIAGNDVRSMSRDTRATLLNRELIAVDQDRRGVQGRRVAARRGEEVWVKPLAGGARAVLLLNRTRRAAVVRAELPRRGRYRVLDLWAHRSRRTGPVLRARVPSHGAAVFKVRRLVGR